MTCDKFSTITSWHHMTSFDMTTRKAQFLWQVTAPQHATDLERGEPREGIAWWYRDTILRWAALSAEVQPWRTMCLQQPQGEDDFLVKVLNLFKHTITGMSMIEWKYHWTNPINLHEIIWNPLNTCHLWGIGARSVESACSQCLPHYFPAEDRSAMEAPCSSP